MTPTPDRAVAARGQTLHELLVVVGVLGLVCVLVGAFAFLHTRHAAGQGEPSSARLDGGLALNSPSNVK